MEGISVRGFVAGVLVTVSAAGCGTAPQMDYSGVSLIPVSGTVTLDGEPLAGAVITFDDREKATFSFARTDEDGYYELKFDTVVDGVTPGTKYVQINTNRTLVGLDPEGGEEDAGGDEVGDEPVADSKKERVPSRYNSDTQLVVEVTEDDTVFDFDLESGQESETAAL